MKVSKATIITIAVLIVILLIAAWFVYNARSKQTDRDLADSPAAQALLPNASSTAFTDFYGNAANLDQHLGKVLVVNSWASWSPFSTKELKLLAKTIETYRDQDVVVLAINRSEPVRTAEQYLKTIGVASEVQLIVDEDDRYYTSIGGYTMPETVFYDREGDVIAHKRGALTADEVRYYVEQAIAQSQD